MKSERRMLTQPPDWWNAFSEAASRDGQTLSEWIGEVCAAQLTERQQTKLSKRRPANRPKNERAK